MGYVIVPILHDAKAKPEMFLESEDFQEILSTLRALASNDDRIIEYFRAIANGKKRPTGGSVTFDIDERIAQKIDLDQFIRDIDLKFWHRLAKLSWRPFEEAREFVRALGLKSQAEWHNYCRGTLPNKGVLPPDIPIYPNEAYSNKGWRGMGDWLGTGTIAPINRNFRDFTSARDFIRKLNLGSTSSWALYCQGLVPEKGLRPSDIPTHPHVIYSKQGWAGMSDWLGTKFRKRYRPFNQARAFAKKLNLSGESQWRAFCKGALPEIGTLPDDIPSSPSSAYSENWKGFGDWLGTGSIATRSRKYRPFIKARAFARSLRLKNQSEWRAFTKGLLPQKGSLPNDIPANPNQTYSDKGWNGIGDWLGTGYIHPRLRKYRSFIQARAFARSLELKNQSEWQAFKKGKLPQKGSPPDDIPANPNQTYADKGWKGMGDWLGTGTIATHLKVYRPFADARRFAHSLHLRNWSEWTAFCKGKIPEKGKLPNDIPVNPRETYKNKGWVSSGDWLGTGTVSNSLKKFCSFSKARSFTRSLKLRNNLEWRAFTLGRLLSKGRLPKDIPATPRTVYANKGWKGFGDWLGTGNPSRKRKSA
jgi:FMN phosphatase YigB (HAD superfamily)